MMKFEKGLWRNTRPQDQPGGTYPFAKNGIKILDGVNQNEPGFVPYNATLPYTFIGVIESDKFPIMFSTDNTHSAIGYFDPENDKYIPIVNDANLPYKLGFKTEYPITGQAQRNYKGEIVIAFTDFNTFPKYLNCDDPVIGTLDDWRLFPLAGIPTMEVNVIEGGILTPGAYYVLAKCLKNDGTETTFLVTSDVILLSGTPDTSTGKALEINLSDIDTNYDLIQIGIISKNAGVTRSFTLEPVPIGSGGTVTVVYSGANVTTDVALEELLVQPVNYDKVKTIGQLNDAIYLGGLEREPEIRMQKYLMLARVEWVSDLIDLQPRNEDHATGRKRSLMHREVYAFYIRLSKKGGGGWTPLFHLPGPAPMASDLNQSSEATTGDLTAKVFQVEDTIRVFDPVAKTGTCGVWVNDDEAYPDTEDFDASDIGGEDLRGQKVRHHRMPSLRWCKQNLYSSQSEYGKSKLDILGIKVSNIIIPNEYADQLDGGYEIFYAKRTISNATVVAQSALLHAARHGSGAGTTTISGPDTDYKTTGGNWNSQIDWSGSSREAPLVIDRKLFRFHAFDLLVNRPTISPKYMCQELMLRRSQLPMIEDFTLTGGKRDAAIIYLADYVQSGSPPIASGSGKLVRRIEDAQADRPQYAPNNLISGKWHNIMAETAFVGKLVGQELLSPSDISYNNLWTGPNSQRPDKAAQFEVCYLSNLMNLPENVYQPFNGQTVVRMGPRQTDSTPLFGGDVFICDYTFHTYGWHDYHNGTYSQDATRDPFMGIKVVRRIACEAASNIYNRFEIPGNVYSKWYPNSPLVKDDITNYITGYDRRIEPNQIGYNKDSNALNDIITAEVFNPLREDIRQFPFRIHRGGKLNRQLKTRSWRTFLPLDYYDIQKDMGVIEHLEGMDDQLLIHTTNALFGTQPKLRLEQDVLSVVIGSGDIFQFEPQEKYSAKLGYAGTRQSLACIRTPAGYVFPDTGQGQIFLYKGQLKLINQGLDVFLRDVLRIKENNPFIGNGITIGYDPKYNRILFTVKNLVKPSNIKELELTQEFIDSLTPGESLVTDKGRLMRFLGPNNTEYQCTDAKPVIVGDVILTIPENTPVSTVIHTVIPISGENLSFYITSGNVDGAFTLEAATGKLKVSNQAAIDYEVRQQIVLQAKAISSNGLSDTFTITVNITAINEPPVCEPQLYTIAEDIPNGWEIGQLPAVDPEGQSLNFTIISGNEDGIFLINSVTGKVYIADNTLLDAETKPVHLLTAAVSDGVNTINVPVTINVANVDEAPPLNDDVINIWDTTPDGTVVYQFSTEDPEGQDITFELVNASHPGVFSLDPATGEVRLVDNDFLNPVSVPQYVLTVRVYDANQNEDTATLVINILYDPETIEFRPAGGSCSGGCPPGYTETDDGLYCERFTRIPATPPSGGTPFSVLPATNDAYSNFGAIIYQPGYSQNGVGTIQHWIQTPTWRNLNLNTIDGALNRCGVKSATVPDNEPIGFSVPIFLPAPATVFVAIAGDNKCRIAINGEILVDQDPVAIGQSLGLQIPSYNNQGIAMAFKFWHIYPFALDAGTHFIGMEGVNYGGPFGFGAEIYKNTPAELIAASLKQAYKDNPSGFPNNQNHYENLDLLFSTRSTRGGTFSSGISGGYSCPVNYAMDGTKSPPECVLVQRIPSTTKMWSNVQVRSLKSGQVIATLLNTPGQTFQGYPVPVYPPVSNHADCGGTAQLYFNAPKSVTVQKNDCEGDLVGSLVKYSVPGGLYFSTVSQAAADSQAQTDIDNNKQQYANENGFCTQQ